jgi:hypothetical protein
VRTSGIHSPSSEPAASSLASARVEPVGLRARLADPGIGRADHDHPGDVRLDDPGQLPSVARHLEHHLFVAAEAPGEQLERHGCRLDPTARPNLTLLDDRDLAKVAMNIQADVSHSILPVDAPLNGENRWANDTDGFVLTAQPGKSQGRPTNWRARSPSRKKRPAHPAFSQKAPVPVRRP